MTEPEHDRVDPILDYVRDHDGSRDLTAKAVVLRLRRAAHYVDTVARRLAPKGTELWELEILANLVRHGGEMSVGQLQEAAQLTAGAITNRITRLEDKGAVRRVVSAADRRQILVTLTAEGEQRAQELIAGQDELERVLFADIDPELLRRLSDDLRAFLVHTDPGLRG
ncbi:MULTISPECIES: MarR family winged helix-turn-helix transcriptional regulator [Mumia]|uniref:MarR family winged helix-turn-helix transcriptional regulator n=1 Tax=Mumia TaxID=1546255 RepID=UPI00141DA88C|nr:MULTISPECIES: MarR family transcriptional regulator [unclassified Mumia]QMW65428.1 MarR family transcriptional regulator [Mumia sp. ZJ1417]